MKPFTFINKPINCDPPNPISSLLSGAQDYPGRVQVKESEYVGGGPRSSFIGRSNGNLGTAFEDWPVQNSTPIGKPVCVMGQCFVLLPK